MTTKMTTTAWRGTGSSSSTTTAARGGGGRAGGGGRCGGRVVLGPSTDGSWVSVRRLLPYQFPRYPPTKTESL